MSENGKIQKPSAFDMKDLFLSAELKVCSNGNKVDFTGRKTFATSFYRENIGFGITDIKIEINPSLQPIVDITFKDLYGNTIFGTKRTDNDSMDTTVLFDWPPPKFIFSFKGYLGRNVTWLLNLKTINTSYDPSDGSYNISCSFVPNQWGFLADLPVLYLLACKKLRYEDYGNKNQTGEGDDIYDTNSIFSIVKSGKVVDIKMEETTKDFDFLKKQMTTLKSSLASGLFGTSGIFKPGEEMKGEVNGRRVKGFLDLKISDGKVGGQSINDIYKKIEIDSKNSSKHTKISNFIKVNLLSKTEDGSYGYICGNTWHSEYENISDRGQYKDGSDDKKLKFSKDLEKVDKIINDNILKIDDDIKRRAYNSSKSEFRQLVIGEVFRQISRDSGYILGKILQAGFDAYEVNKDMRNNSNALIGKYFPLISMDGEELPATRSNSGGDDFGVDGNDSTMGEMDFVDKFIDAIGEGIASELVGDESTTSSNEKVQNRINNLEVLQGNPYKPYYSNVVENILIRSGIIAFVTRSNTPEQPSTYGPGVIIFSNDKESNIKALAESDIENLTEEILSQMSFDNIQSLKKFCKFFDNLICEEDFNYFLMPLNIDGSKNDKMNINSISTSKNPNSESVPDDIMDYKIILSNGLDSFAVDYYVSLSDEIKYNADMLYEKLTEELVDKNKDRIDNYNFEKISVREVFQKVLKPSKEYNPEEKDLNVQEFHNTSYIDEDSLTANIVKNNGLFYTMPQVQIGQPIFILFDDISDVSEIRTIPPSSEKTTDEKIEGNSEGGTWVGDVFTSKTSQPIGFIEITEKEDSNKNKIINNAISDGRVINYRNTKINLDSDNLLLYLQPPENTIQTSGVVKQPNELDAKNLCYSVYSLSSYDSYSDGLVFGPFIKDGIQNNSNRSKHQRVAIKTMCKSILKKIEELESKKNRVISDFFGKANQHRDVIYKQMHTIFHQWQTIASTVDGGKYCSEYKGESDDSLGELLENEYGSRGAHIKKGDGISDKNTLFVYDYPLNSVRGTGQKQIDVKDSIISIEPLYKPNANTTVLNIVQQICTSNNFVFVPFPGDGSYGDVKDIYEPSLNTEPKIQNFFHVLFTPTPETRTKLNDDSSSYLSELMRGADDFENDAISIRFGGVNNQIVNNMSVSTDSTKPTAESIVNLQRLVDKENTNRSVGINCSMLPVYEGRSYKMSVDMIGNAQVYPMQYFYVENKPMFGGLYQIMKVSHSITPNNMTTSLEGIRMRFTTKDGYCGIEPITLGSLEDLGETEQALYKPPLSFDELSAMYNNVYGESRKKSMEVGEFVTPIDDDEYSSGKSFPAPDLSKSVPSFIIPRYLSARNYYQYEEPKKTIFIHFTAGSPNAKNTIAFWEGQSNKVATSFVVDGNDGGVYMAFHPDYYANHLGTSHKNNHYMHKSSIGIEMCSYGPLKKRGNKYYAWPSDWKTEVSSDRVVELDVEWRGYEYFQAYTDKQLLSLEKLLDYLITNYKIQIQEEFDMTWFHYKRDDIMDTMKSGIWSHSNVRTDKSDTYPDFKVIQILRRLSKKYYGKF